MREDKTFIKNSKVHFLQASKASIKKTIEIFCQKLEKPYFTSLSKDKNFFKKDLTN